MLGNLEERDIHYLFDKCPKEVDMFRSGVVEAACKSIVQLRIKRSGQRWDDDGGQAILTFRSLVKSNQFDQAWELVKDFYQHNLQLPKNVIKFPAK